MEEETKQPPKLRESKIAEFVTKEEWESVDSSLRKELREKLTEEQIREHIELIEKYTKRTIGILYRKEWRELTKEEQREVVIRDLVLYDAVGVEPTLSPEQKERTARDSEELLKAIFGKRHRKPIKK